MKTADLNVMTLCAPCANRCRYCLLSCDGAVPGAELERSMDYARRFAAWLREQRPETAFLFGWGYSMEHPKLLDAVRFSRELGCVTGEFLQFDGMAFRTREELAALLSDLKRAGIRLIDLTFYGTEAYHDRFAARRGDHRLMIDTLQAARAVGLDVSASVPVTQENLAQVPELLEALDRYRPARKALFVPHAEGRGKLLDPVRLRLEDLDAMPQEVRRLLNRDRFRTEGEWLRLPRLPEFDRRSVTVMLTRENIAQLEERPFADVLEEIEDLDDAYHSAIPAPEELAKLYGKPDNSELYSFRDLLQHWQRRYIRDYGLDLYDIHDERHSFVRRY